MGGRRRLNGSAILGCERPMTTSRRELLGYLALWVASSFAVLAVLAYLAPR
jgi:hypothetical protein